MFLIVQLFFGRKFLVGKKSLFLAGNVIQDGSDLGEIQKIRVLTVDAVGVKRSPPPRVCHKLLNYAPLEPNHSPPIDEPRVTHMPHVSQ